MTTSAAQEFDPQSIAGNAELKAFLEFRSTGKIPLKHGIPLALKALVADIPLALLRAWPGPIGIKLRQLYYGLRFQQMGAGVIIESGADILRPGGISAADFVFIDKHVSLHLLSGTLTLGRRIHIAPYALIAGASDIHLGDYCGIGAYARIYSHSEAPVGGKRMTGPMIPEDMKGMITAPVYVGKDAVIGTGAVVLPGCVIGEGAIVGANSLVPARTKIPPYTIYVGVPVRFAGMRERVSVPDI